MFRKRRNIAVDLPFNSTGRIILNFTLTRGLATSSVNGTIVTGNINQTFSPNTAGVVKILQKNKITQLVTPTTANTGGWNFNASVFGQFPKVERIDWQAPTSLITGVFPRMPNLTSLALRGQNTVSNVSTLINLTSLDLRGQNTVSDVSALLNLTFLRLFGQNTVSNVSALVNLTSLLLWGNNTVSNVSALVNLTFLNLQGQNTIPSLPAFVGNPTTIIVIGQNTISSFPSQTSAVTNFEIRGNNTISSYTSRSWSNNINRLVLLPVAGGGLTSAMVDQLIIDVNGSAWAGTSRTLDLRGTNAPRTSASNAAVAALVAKSVNVLTN